ncbi:MFS transporter [Corynebacterium sp. ES2794-CONJ1]|uniref:MFS transporter n=1 Tax=unclassified Corynebacterium TaxID=2624378 RepID=UPI002167ACF0|nr:MULTISPECIES: MFS transporter [unclassified Corynebacterium]MCS4489529.1 MFS transporter [Corynebacterium sp. ES2775-CONJ]MCS4491460.1 MFS transporter [Corynebacterium sp. ES2715-CONJ3]MCS4531439.1 MFS transporter [Corynebacterium sp. ES2730-CONJ]MCU9518827.1 MFS transporter [Corynebacterium sp. ES2794-CONJ1]
MTTQSAQEKRRTVPHKPLRRVIPRQDEISTRQRLIVWIALGLAGFAIGVNEFVTMGLLRNIAEAFNLTEGTASLIISSYALGVVLGAPLITAFTGMMPRRRLVLILMAAFTLGNAMTVVSPSFEVLVIARFIAALPHGAFFSVAALVTTSMADPRHRGRALAFVGMGFPLSSLIGVPLAQAIGVAYGWYNAYVFVTVISLITVVALWLLMPHMNKMLPTSPLAELSSLKRGQVWLSLMIGAVGFGGMFAVYTYISWTMTQRAGVPETMIWLVLSIYGVGMIVGNWAGGRLSDWSVEGGIFVTLVAIVLSLLSFFALSAWMIPAIINFAVIGASASALIPCLQIRLMDVAGKAKTLAGALNHSALNIANAAGASMGGAVIAAGYGYASPALVGAGLGALAIVVWALAATLRRRQGD